jgi:predicted deacylase
LKNNYIALFTAGILVGATIMFFVLGSAIPVDNSLSAETNTPASQTFPHLIALEPTTGKQKATFTPVFPTPTVEPTLVPTWTAVTATPTALILLNKQQSEIIGYSMEGKPLIVYIFGNGTQERMIVAGIHGGDEWNTVTLSNQIIKYLNQNSDEIPEDVTLYILPNLNPDGERRAHNKYGRLNDDGVDLNRNFPINWKQDWDRSSCWNYLPSSGGMGPGSEPETQALMNFIEKHKIQALISYHSAALGIFPGGLPWEKHSIGLAQSIANVTSYPFPPLDTGCTYSGTLADYAVSKGIAAVDLELTNHIETDFDQNLHVLNVLLKFEP